MSIFSFLMPQILRNVLLRLYFLNCIALNFRTQCVGHLSLRYILEVRINKGKFLKVVLLTLITRVDYSYYSRFRLEFHIVPCLPLVYLLQW